MDPGKDKPLILAGVAGFILVLIGLVWLGVSAVRANLNLPAAGVPRPSPVSSLDPGTDDNFTPVPVKYTYVARSPDDGRFSVEVPPDFHFKYDKKSFTAPDGELVPIHSYTAGGGTDVIDGFAVICYEGLSGKRKAEMTEEDVITELAKGLFQQTHCTVNLHDSRHRSVGDVVHMDGKGWEDNTGRNFWMVLEGSVVNDDVYLVFVAGYRAQVVKDPRSEHFFDTFDPHN